MLEAVKRKFGQHRSYRRLRKHWEDFLGVKEGAFDVYGPHLNEFLLTFETMYVSLNDDNKRTGAALDKVYGDCTEIMVCLVNWLHQHSAARDCDWSGTGLGLGLKALRVVEFILQNEKYRQEAAKHDVTAKVVVLLDVEQLDAKTILLKLIASLGTNEKSRLEIVRLHGLGKMTQFLKQGDADLTKQILKTLRELCNSPLEDGSKKREDKEEASAAEVPERPLEGESPKSEPTTPKPKLSITGVVQGFSKLARSYFPLNETHESKAQPHKRGAKTFPPRRRDLVEMVNRLEALRAECARESPDSSTQDVLPALILGMISPAIPSIQIDLLATICQLLYKNKRNQKTFVEVGGYPSVLQLLEEAIRVDNPTFLAQCFHIIFTLILDGGDSKEIGNLDALAWLFEVIQTSAMTPIRVHAGECLLNLITVNPLNAIYFRQVGGPGLLLSVIKEQCQRALIGLDDGSRAVPCGELVADCRGPGPDWAVLEAVDALLRSIIAVFTRFDSSIATEYAQLLWQVPIGALHPDFTLTLSSTVAELLCHFHLFHVEIVEGAVELSLQLVRTSMNVLAMALHKPSQEVTNDFVSGCPFHGAECVLKSGNNAPWNEIQVSLLTPDVICRQITIVLQILGHAVLGRETAHKVSIFHRHAGFRVLIDLVSLMAACNTQSSSDVTDLALFLLRRCAVVWCQLNSKRKSSAKPQDDSVKDLHEAYALVPLLEVSLQLPLHLQLKICKTIIVLFRAVPDPNVSLRSISRSSSRSTRSSKSVSRSSRNHFRRSPDDESQRKKLRQQTTELQTALKISFCNAGGLDCLVNIMKSGTASDITFTTAAFLCVAELIRQCEPVKIYFGRHVGYCEFAETVKRTHMVLENHIFDVAFELSTTGDLTLMLPAGASSFQKSVDLVMSQVFTSLEDEGLVSKFVKAVSPLPRESERKKDTRDETKEKTWAPVHTASGHLMRERNDSDTDSICSDLELDLTQTTQLDGDLLTDSILPVTPMGTPLGKYDTLVPPSRADSLVLEEASLPIDDSRLGAEVSINSRNRDASLLEQEELLLPVAAEEEPEQKQSWQTLTTMKFRSSEAALMVIVLLPHAPPAVQSDVIKRLSILLEANPSNKRALCQVGVVSILLRLYPYFHEEAQSLYLQLIANLGTYDVTQKEIRLLFDMAASPPNTSLHLDSTQLRMPLYHSSITPEELQMQMLYVIGRLAERSAPANYFSFDGLVSSLRLVPLVRFPASKGGYSMNCWLQVSLFFEQESSLLTWEDHSGSIVFELLFLCHPVLKPARFLAVRTKQGTFPFRQYCFEESTDWHHLVISHDKRALRITLDGRGTSLFKEIAYPVASKTTPLTGRIGTGAPDSKATSFCGALGSVNFFEGAIEKHHTKLLFEQGPLFGDTRDFKQLGIANKIFLTLNPEEFELETNKAKAHLPALPSAASLERSLLDISSLVMAAPGEGSIPETSQKVLVSPVLEAVGEIEVHTTRSMKREIGRVGSIFLCLPFLNMGSGQMIAGLRLMAALLDKFQPNIQTFQKSNGFDVLTYLLTSNKTELSREVFDLLLDMTHGQIGVQMEKRRLAHLAGLQAIVDLLRDPKCELETRNQVLTMLAQPITRHSKSLNTWRAGPGIAGVIELLLSPGGLYPHLLVILAHILPICRFEEFEILACFLVAEIEAVHFQEEVCGLFRLMVDVMAKRPSLIEYLLKMGGFDLIYLFLRSPLEPVRVDCCRLLGLLFSSSSRNASSFLKSAGYDIVVHLMEAQPVSGVMLSALTHLALGKFIMQTIDAEHETPSNEISQNDHHCEHDHFEEEFPKDDDDDDAERQLTSSSRHSQSSVVVSEFQRDIMFPHVLQVNMRLLRLADLPTSLNWLNQLDLILDKLENIDRILDTDWLLWCHAYLQADMDVDDPNHMQRVLAKFYSVLQKTVIRDLARPAKQCELIKLKELPETADFFLIVFENVLDYFEQHPRVETTSAVQLFRNLGLVFDYVESVIGLPPSMCVRAISVINLLASQNESTIRVRMKDSGLFDIRDNIVVRCIREDMPQEVRLDTFCVVSFEMVAAQPIFRDSGGIVCMLKMLHDCGNIQLQEAIADILRNQLSRVDECKKTLMKCIQDSLVFKLLCAPDPELEESSSSFTPGAETVEDDAKIEYPNDDSISEFIRWYFAEPQRARREVIQLRVAKHFVPYQTAAIRSNTKLAARKDKALKQRLNKLSTSEQAKRKIIGEVLTRGKTRMLPKCLSKVTAKLNDSRDAHLARHARGKSSWKELCADLKLDNPIKPELKLVEEDEGEASGADADQVSALHSPPLTPPAVSPPPKSKTPSPITSIKSPKRTSATTITSFSNTTATATVPTTFIAPTVPTAIALEAAAMSTTTTESSLTSITPDPETIIDAAFSQTSTVTTTLNPGLTTGLTTATALSGAITIGTTTTTTTAGINVLAETTNISTVMNTITTSANTPTTSSVPTLNDISSSTDLAVSNKSESTSFPSSSSSCSCSSSSSCSCCASSSSSLASTSIKSIKSPLSISTKKPPDPPPLQVLSPSSKTANENTKQPTLPLGDLQVILAQLQTANQQTDQLGLILQMQAQLQAIAAGLATKPLDSLETEESPPRPRKETDELKKKRMSQDAFACLVCGTCFQSSWDQMCHSRLDH